MIPEGGVLASLWLLGLWFAAPLLGTDDATTAGRLRNVIVLGTSIPFVLALFTVLHAAECWLVLGMLCALRLALRNTEEMRQPLTRSDIIAATIGLAALAAVAWPALVHPPMDGDTLAYHLPNAAAWARTGSFWNTDGRYWYYPGGSELFAAPLIAIGALSAVGTTGTLAAALLVLRVTSWSRELGVPAVVAGLLGASIATTHVVVNEAGNLGNDVLLAAFVLEILHAGIRRNWQAAGVAGLMTVLVKPFGVILAGVALLTVRPPWKLALVAMPFALWMVRDLVLAPHALLPIGSSAGYPLWETTIARHGVDGATTFARAIWHSDLWTLVLTAGLLAAPFTPVPGIAATGLGAFALFWVLPFGFSDSDPQLATGASLRILLPALACGAIALAPVAARLPIPAAFVALVASVIGIRSTAALFWNDAATRDLWTVAVLVLAVGCAMTALGRAWRPAAAAGLICALLAVAGMRAALHPLGYLDDWLGGPATPTRVFDAIAADHPNAIVTAGVRAGSIVIASPQTRVIDGLDGDELAQARGGRAWLLIARDNSVRQQLARQSAAAGDVRYEDSAVLLVGASWATGASFR
jgi:hypothetical protein